MQKFRVGGYSGVSTTVVRAVGPRDETVFINKLIGAIGGQGQW